MVTALVTGADDRPIFFKVRNMALVLGTCVCPPAFGLGDGGSSRSFRAARFKESPVLGDRPAIVFGLAFTNLFRSPLHRG